LISTRYNRIDGVYGEKNYCLLELPVVINGKIAKNNEFDNYTIIGCIIPCLITSSTTNNVNYYYPLQMIDTIESTDVIIDINDANKCYISKIKIYAPNENVYHRWICFIYCR
jgi:hypothetical protein